MWRCGNCKTEIADNYLHCWQCGKRRVFQSTSPPQTKEQVAVPAFESYEEIARSPTKLDWLFRFGPLARLSLFLIFAVIFKVVSAVSESPFLAAYGTYILLGIAVVALVVILWRHFHRDPTEGVGINLH